MTTALITVSKIEVPASIAHAYASRQTALNFLHKLLANPADCDMAALHQARYAYARASYREGCGLLIENLALLCNCSVSHVMHFGKKLLGENVTTDTYFTNNECSQIMSNMMEM